MTKLISVNCYFVEPRYAELFRLFVAHYDEPRTWQEEQARTGDEEPTVEILYEETCEETIGRVTKGTVGFDLWFIDHSAAFYFGRAWERQLLELIRTQARDLHTRLEAVYNAEIRLVLKDTLYGTTKQEAQEMKELGERQEQLFPEVAQVLGWDWAAMTTPGRLRYATPSQTTMMLQELSKLIGGQGNG